MAEYATKQEVQEIVDKAVTDLSEIIANFAQQVVGRIDRYESGQVARDSQFNRLPEWARKVSEKTGIPLKNL